MLEASEDEGQTPVDQAPIQALVLRQKLKHLHSSVFSSVHHVLIS